MTLHRFILPFTVSDNHVVITDPRVVLQCLKVLRLREGEHVGICDGQGNEIQGTIAELSKINMTVSADKRVNHKKPEREVSLYCAILKKDNFELVAQKATEIGVASMYPLLTARTIKPTIDESRLQKIILEAAEQSGQGYLPVVHAAASLPLKTVPDGEKILFDISGDAMEKLSPGSVSIAIGPEGGWLPQEITDARQAGWKVVSLGSSTLRGETAAIVAAYAAVSGM